jgi:hypothetical protein
MPRLSVASPPALHRTGLPTREPCGPGRALLPRGFTLAGGLNRDFGGLRFRASGGSFLWRVPYGCPFWELPSALPCGARTFLTLRQAHGAAAKPPAWISYPKWKPKARVLFSLMPSKLTLRKVMRALHEPSSPFALLYRCETTQAAPHRPTREQESGRS